MQNPIVTFETTKGVIKAELYPEIAPNTVNNFISLVSRGFYDGTIFHRVIPGFMIQGGDPEGTGMGGPGSEFFIMVDNAPYLDGQYAAFGKVIEGIDVAQAIVSSPRDRADRPHEDQIMEKVTVETFGAEYGEPVTGPEHG